MKYNSLHFLLVLFALQSTIAMANFYQPHHSEAEHIQTLVTENTLSGNELKSHQSTTTEVNHSCHHFCASHSITFINLNDLMSIKSLIYNSNLLNTYSNRFKNRTITPDLRPPII